MRVYEAVARPYRRVGHARWLVVERLSDGSLKYYVSNYPAPWKDLPGRYPFYQTCHRRYQEKVENGSLEKILKRLANDLEEHGEIDLSETFIDGSFASAKKGGGWSG